MGVKFDFEWDAAPSEQDDGFMSAEWWASVTDACQHSAAFRPEFSSRLVQEVWLPSILFTQFS